LRRVADCSPALPTGRVRPSAQALGLGQLLGASAPQLAALRNVGHVLLQIGQQPLVLVVEHLNALVKLLPHPVALSREQRNVLLNVFPFFPKLRREALLSLRQDQTGLLVRQAQEVGGNLQVGYGTQSLPVAVLDD
jgi:hypothetical protein